MRVFRNVIQKSLKTLFRNEKRDKKYLHSKNYSEYDFEFFFLRYCSPTLSWHSIWIPFSTQHKKLSLVFIFELKLFNDTKQRNKIIIDESLFFEGEKENNNNIYQFSVSHKFSNSTVTFLFVSRHCCFEFKRASSGIEFLVKVSGILILHAFSCDFRLFSFIFCCCCRVNG